MGFTKFRVTVGTSLCTTAQHISSKIKAFLHHLCWVILILNYAIPYLTPLSLTYPEVRFPWSTQKSQYFFSSQNVFDCQKWLSKFVQSIDIVTISVFKCEQCSSSRLLYSDLFFNILKPCLNNYVHIILLKPFNLRSCLRGISPKKHPMLGNWHFVKLG